MKRNLFAGLFFSVILLSLSGCGGGAVESVSNADAASVRSAPEIAVAEKDWPWWSGPQRNFVAVSKKLEIDLENSDHLKWQVSVPGAGHASPIVIGDKVFLASADESSKSKFLVCLDRADGKLLWNTELHQGRFMTSHNKSSQASATPASDGQQVYTAFMFDDGIQVSAVDLSGKVIWQTTAGGFRPRHGFGSSPVLYRSLVIVAGDNPGSSFLTAMDRKSGDIVWRISRDNESSYATPTVVRIDSGDQLIMTGARKTHAYDPADGSLLWESEGPAQTTANTIATDGSTIIAGGGYPEHQVYAIDIATQEVSWKESIKNYVPSPVIWDSKVIVPQDNGILTCLNVEDGSEVWKKRLGNDVSGSPVRVGDRCLIGGEKGRLFLVDLKTGEIESKIDLDSRIMSTPAVAGNQIFVRSAGQLYCFEKPAK